MIRLKDAIRLTSREAERWLKITGFPPEDIRTIEHLDDYIGRCKAFYWGTSKETRYLHWLIDHERALQLGLFHEEAAPAWPPGFHRTPRRSKLQES